MEVASCVENWCDHPVSLKTRTRQLHTCSNYFQSCKINCNSHNLIGFM